MVLSFFANPFPPLITGIRRAGKSAAALSARPRIERHTQNRGDHRAMHSLLVTACVKRNLSRADRDLIETGRRPNK
jgi:hypothetical protein